MASFSEKLEYENQLEVAGIFQKALQDVNTGRWIDYLCMPSWGWLHDRSNFLVDINTGGN